MRRVCVRCNVVEPKWWVLVVYPSRMFKIWKGSGSDVNLCSFDCEKIYRRNQKKRGGDE